MEELTITVQIADRPYRIKISNEEEEEVTRKAAKLIKGKLTEYASDYAFNDKQDLLAMVTLHFATAAMDMEDNNTLEQSKLIKNLGDIETKLTEQLD